MADDPQERLAAARSAIGDELTALVHDAAEEVLAAVLENPSLNEQHLILLLERKGLPGSVVQRIAKNREWLRSYPVKKRVAAHPRTPRLLAIPLLRQLYLFDLAEVSLQPSTPAELKRIAEEVILSKLAQLPLGQKITLAKRGSARVAGALLADGHSLVFPHAVQNAFLTEAQVLKALARDDLPAGVAEAIAQDRKWSAMPNVRVALIRNPTTPLGRVLAFLPDLALRELNDLCAAQSLSENLRKYLEHEVARRQKGRRRVRAGG